MRPASYLPLPHPRHALEAWCVVGDDLRPCKTPPCPSLRPDLLQSAGSFLESFFRFGKGVRRQLAVRVIVVCEAPASLVQLPPQLFNLDALLLRGLIPLQPTL